MIFTNDSLEQILWCYYLEQIEKVGDSELLERMDEVDTEFNHWSVLCQMVSTGLELNIALTDSGVELTTVNQ